VANRFEFIKLNHAKETILIYSLGEAEDLELLEK
jgi:hypothetical protein